MELVVGSASLEAGRALARRLLEVSITLVAVDGTRTGRRPTSYAVASPGWSVGSSTSTSPRGSRRCCWPSAGSRRRRIYEPLDDVRAVAATLPAPAAVVDPTTLVLGRSGRWHEALDAERQADLLVALVQRYDAEAGHSRVVVLLDPGTRPRGCAVSWRRPPPPSGPT